jgi:hypothetical protein
MRELTAGGLLPPAAASPLPMLRRGLLSPLRVKMRPAITRGYWSRTPPWAGGASTLRDGLPTASRGLGPARCRANEADARYA